MKNLFTVLVFLLTSSLSFADSTIEEQENIMDCAEQFGNFNRAEEEGELTGLIEVISLGDVRIFSLIQDQELRGLYSIDAQGDISEVDSLGNFKKMCQ